MVKPAPYIAALLLVSLGCSARGSSAAVTDSNAKKGSSSEASAGSGHLHLTGDVTLDHDFVVDACQIAPAGDGLLAGYHMNAKDGDSTLTHLSIVLKNYDKDGPYSPADKSEEAQVGAAMATGDMGPLSLMVTQPSSPMPLAPMLKPASTMVINVSDNGNKGDAKFTDLETMPSFEDIDLKSSTPPHGKKLSGSITWTCGKIDTLNAQMNSAVNGMFDKLMKTH